LVVSTLVISHRAARYFKAMDLERVAVPVPSVPGEEPDWSAE